MEIINKEFNIIFQQANHFCLGGCISGAMRMVLGIIQAIINVVAGIFFALASLCLHIPNNSPYQHSKFFVDALEGLLHVTRGFVEMLPFSEICLDCRMDGRWKELIDSHPYHGQVVDDYEHLPWTTIWVFEQIHCC